MKAKNNQKYMPGAIVKIQLSGGRFAFGRLMPGVASVICVYDLVLTEGGEVPIDEMIRAPLLFCCGIYRGIITKGIFEKVGFRSLTDSEINSVPPFFTQDLVNIYDCVICWIKGGERKATPLECIGLERSSVWDEKSLVERIEDYYSGKKNFHVEHQKVILSNDDPRYLPPPQALKWDFEKQEFYRVDRK